MTCVDNVCGTGGWTGPKPGDPDNNIALSANTVQGGIDVSWSYPATYPHAVIHTLLYRGTDSTFGNAAQRAVVAGSIFFDKSDVTVDTEFYYWIQIVSVNGTTMDPIGPVSATARVPSQQTLESLTGLIDSGVLAQSLKTSIVQIDVIDGRVTTEVADRITSTQQLAATIDGLNAQVNDAVTLLNQEVTQRTDGDSALVTAINDLGARVDSNIAAITNEQTVRATKDDAMASDIQVLYSKASDSASALETEKTTRANADSALAEQITTAQSQLDGNISAVQVDLQTKIDTTNGKVTEIGALYTAKVQVNGLIGGFGVYNDGTEVEAGFDVDRFWVGRTVGSGTNAVKPFIVDNDVVYMDKAIIRNADIDTLKLAGEAVSVPISVSCYKAYAGQGIGNYMTISEGYFNMSDPGILYALFTGAATFPTGDKQWRMRMRINGVIKQEIGGAKFNDAPSLSSSCAVPAGLSHVEVLWYADTNRVKILTSTLFMIATKK